jgi:hypothetical protein
MTLTISPIVIWFIAGFIAAIIIFKYGIKILWNLWKLLFTLHDVLIYNPKVNRYKKLLLKRGWIQKNEYSEFGEWEHPEKGQKMFYNAVCLETGKKPNI